MKATFTDHRRGVNVLYEAVTLPVWNTQGNPIASVPYVVNNGTIQRTSLHAEDNKIQDFVVNLINVHFCGMNLDVPQECPVKKLYTSSDLKLLFDWYSAQYTENGNLINALKSRVLALETRPIGSPGFSSITPKLESTIISLVTSQSLAVNALKDKLNIIGDDDELQYTSKNPELFTIENGNLVKKGTGIGTVEVSSKTNPEVKATLKVLSIRPEDVSIVGVNGGTSAPDSHNLDINPTVAMSTPELNVNTVTGHDADRATIKNQLNANVVYDVSSTNGLYRLNSGALELTNKLGTGTLNKTISISYDSTEVKSERVSTAVSVSRSPREIVLKNNPLFVVGVNGMEYPIGDVLDIKYDGPSGKTTEPLSEYTVKTGSTFVIESNKLKYTGTGTGNANLVLVNSTKGVEASKTIKTYTKPTFGNIDSITFTNNSTTTVTVLAPTGDIMSVDGIRTEYQFANISGNYTVSNTNNNTVNLTATGVGTGKLKVTRTVKFGNKEIAKDVKDITVTINSDTVPATGIESGPFKLRHSRVVMLKVDNDNGLVNNIPISSLARLVGPRGMTSQLRAKFTMGGPFSVQNDKLVVSSNQWLQNNVRLYASDNERVYKDIQVYSFDLPTLNVDKTSISAHVGDSTQKITGRLEGRATNMIEGFSSKVTYSTTSDKFSVDNNGNVTFNSVGSGTIAVHAVARVDNVIIFDETRTVNVSVAERVESRRIVLKGPALNDPMVVFNDRQDVVGKQREEVFGYNDDTSLSYFVAIEGGTGKTNVRSNSFHNATGRNISNFDIQDNLLEDKLGTVTFYIEGTNITKTINVQHYKHPNPVFAAFDHNITVGDNPTQLGIEWSNNPACVRDAKFRHTVEWYVEGGIGTISNGEFSPITAGSGKIKARVVCYWDDHKILDKTIAEDVTVKARPDVYVLSGSTDNVTIYNYGTTSKLISITSTKNGQPISPAIRVETTSGSSSDVDVTYSSGHLTIANAQGNTHNSVSGTVVLTNGDKTLRIPFELQYQQLIRGISVNPSAIKHEVYDEGDYETATARVDVNTNASDSYTYYDIIAEVDPSTGYESSYWIVNVTDNGSTKQTREVQITLKSEYRSYDFNTTIIVKSKTDPAKQVKVPVMWKGQNNSDGPNSTPTPDLPSNPTPVSTPSPSPSSSSTRHTRHTPRPGVRPPRRGTGSDMVEE